MPSWLRLLLGVLLGVTLLGRGLQWFNDYLDRSQKPTYAAASPGTAPAPDPSTETI